MISGNINSTYFSIYNCGEMEVKEYYISWTPSTASGSFKIDGVTYRLESYSGYFSNFSGVITSDAFWGKSITTLDTNAYMIKSDAFGSCGKLSIVSLPECTSLAFGVFASCSILASVYAPVCSILGEFAFSSCKSLTYISLPECITLSAGAFEDCTNLEGVSLPKCTYILAGAFSSCTHLLTISLPNCSFIGSWAFMRCLGLQEMILGSTSVCTLQDKNAFNLTYQNWLFYVPSSLVSDYKTAPHWSYFSSRIYPISE